MKKYNIVISKDAWEDIEDAFKYISDILFEPDIAKKIQRTLLIRIKSLETMPKRNAVIDMEPYKTRGVRILLIENYKVFYVVDEEKDMIYILNVLYKHRDWQNII